MKLSAGVAGAAFLLSLLIGFVSGAGFVSILLRALFFSALFFGFSVGTHQVLSRFLPELLGISPADGSENDSDIGSRVDLVVGEEEGIAAMGKEPQGISRKRTTVPDEVEEAEEIDAFVPLDSASETAAAALGPVAEEGDALGLDQGGEGRYTRQKDTGVSLGSKGVEAALPPGLIDDVDVLPDLESMTDSFVSPLVEEAAERSLGESYPSSLTSTSRSSELGGDFDPREMASAIQTILKRDQKG